MYLTTISNRQTELKLTCFMHVSCDERLLDVLLAMKWFRTHSLKPPNLMELSGFRISKFVKCVNLGHGGPNPISENPQEVSLRPDLH